MLFLAPLGHALRQAHKWLTSNVRQKKQTMNPNQLIVDSLSRSEDKSFLIFLVVLAVIAWLWSVVVVAREKTEDPFDRIVWLLIILSLNIVGTILYVFFSSTKKAAAPDEADLKRRANDGTL